MYFIYRKITGTLWQSETEPEASDYLDMLISGDLECYRLKEGETFYEYFHINEQASGWSGISVEN